LIIIQEHTTKNPITLIGEEAGICYGADTSNQEKNYNRGLDCLKSNHGRTLEFPSIYVVVDEYSAKMVRELYTHIGGAPTRLQSSTRYIKYGDYKYVTPPSIEKSEEANAIYKVVNETIVNGIKRLRDLGVPNEDATMLLPLCMETKVVCKYNPRTLIDMSHQRECTRAYWEFRNFMKELSEKLSEYSEEWKLIVDNYFEPKCELLGYCPEKFSCGRYPQK
jgi:thymidylate synthase (FAD)